MNKLTRIEASALFKSKNKDAGNKKQLPQQIQAHEMPKMQGRNWNIGSYTVTVHRDPCRWKHCGTKSGPIWKQHRQPVKSGKENNAYNEHDGQPRYQTNDTRHTPNVQLPGTCRRVEWPGDRDTHTVVVTTLQHLSCVIPKALLLALYAGNFMI